MQKYKVEMMQGQPQRYVEADDFKQDVANGWLIFYRKPATGGTVEYWRVRIEHVVSMETQK